MIAVTFKIKEDGQCFMMKTGRVDFPDAPATDRELEIAKEVCDYLDAFPKAFAEKRGAQFMAIKAPRQRDGN